MQILITGATGLIGRALASDLLARGDEVVAISRDASRAALSVPDDAEILEADVTQPGPWLDRAQVADAVVNLVGENIGEGVWWTGGKRRAMRRSRLRPTSLLADAMRERERPGVLINASATGYYGDAGEQPLPETAEPGGDFLAMLTYEWERHALRAESERCRVVCTRFSPVLAAEGGMLQKLEPVFRKGLGGRLGSGRQYWPWIHRRDAVRALQFALDTPALRGPMNVCTPNPPTQGEFARTLAETLDRPARLPAPAWALRLLLGEKGTMLLASQRALPNQLKAHGFRWEYAELDRALADLISA